MSREFIRELRCRKCGKNFCPAPQHIYKDSKGMYCSWTCYNHRNDGRAGGHYKGNGKRKKVCQYTKDGEIIMVHASTADAARSIKGNQSSISKCCREKRPYKGFIWKYREETEKNEGNRSTEIDGQSEKGS